ncbi:MAG: amino acid synthesis family protein [Burkholderiales bacterium]|nr:amino acid synthesis family protein [Burkholderiales bacterium]
MRGKSGTVAAPAGVGFVVRKIVTMVEEIRHEGGPPRRTPVRRGAIAAVVANPFAGRHVADLMSAMDGLKPIGYDLAARLIRLLGGPGKVDAYGKSVIVGVAGESEHAALWHVPGGYGMRELLDQSLAIVPSTIKVAPAGTVIDVPLHHRTAAYVRSHFDSVEMRVPDAPRPDEIVFILAMGAGGRVHQRMGGLGVGDIAKFDGQR